MPELMEIRNLEIQYVTERRVVRAVNGIDLTIRKGETVGLVGETGAGKTTTALGIMQLVPDPPGKIVGGEVLWNGEDLLKMSQKELRKIRGSQISMIFQDPMTSLNPVITIGEQVAEVIRLHEHVSKAEANIKAQNILKQVGILPERFQEYPHQFSGGMRQRVVIAIALACNPSLLIADEPTTALDVTIQAQVLSLMAELKNHFATSMLLITHDLGVVAEVCDRVAIMYAGQIVEEGPLRKVFRNPLHPYTEGLFQSIPDIHVKTERLKPIMGYMPDPANLPDGCYFASRCPYCEAACTQNTVPAFQAEEDHIVRCIRCKKREVET